MADIFISYATSDRGVAKSLAGHLAGLGYSVWWDREMVAGDDFGVVFRQEIDRAKVVLVLWSESANQSRWVLDEADVGLKQGKLVPAFIEKVNPPLGFGRIHARILYDNALIHKASGFTKLLQDLDAKISAAPAVDEGTSNDVVRPSSPKPSGASAPSGATAPPVADDPHKKYWWLVAIVVPIAVALIAVIPPFLKATNTNSSAGTNSSAQQGDLAQQIEDLKKELAKLRKTKQESKEKEQQLVQAKPADRDNPDQSKQLAAMKKEQALLKDQLQVKEAALSAAQAKLLASDSGSVATVGTTPVASSPGTAEIREPGSVFRDPFKDDSGDFGPEMVVIPAGRFKMGDIQGGGLDDEKPVREVRIAKAFAMGRYEVRFSDYELFVNATNDRLPDDEDWGRGDRPVINVSWHDAVAYAKWLSDKTGFTYLLPSEAEWEYAARAKTESKYWWGNAIGRNNANCYGCGSQWDGNKTAPVGSFDANAFGLYDTVGNVWEWVQDCFHEDYKNAPRDGRVWAGGNCDVRVLRGGSWFSDPLLVRSSNRNWLTPVIRLYFVGFRLARTL